MLIAFYVSGHGLGHASRDTELIESLLASMSTDGSWPNAS